MSTSTEGVRKSKRNMSSSQVTQAINVESADEAFIQSPPSAMASINEITKIAEFKEAREDLNDFTKASLDEKMNKLMKTMQTVLDVHQELANNLARHEYHLLHATDGVNPRLAKIQDQVDQNTESLNQLQMASKKELKEAVKEIKAAREESEVFAKKTDLEMHQTEVKSQIDDLISTIPESAEMECLRKEFRRAISIIGKQEKQIDTLNQRVLDLTARSMDTNFTAVGIMEPFQLRQVTPKDAGTESCEKTVQDFLKEKMGLRIELEEIVQAYRIGRIFPASYTARPRLLFFQTTAKWSQKIKNSANNLRDLKNEIGQQYTISQQLPDGLIASRGKINEILKPIKEANKTKPFKEKVKFSIHQNKLYVEGEKMEEKVLVPTAMELFTSVEHQAILDQIDLSQTEREPFMGSSFTGFALQVADLQDVRNAYIKVMQDNAHADHVIMAFKVADHSGCQDNGEHRAAKKILKLLEEKREENLAVFVVREYGGRPLGPARFECILKSAQKALDILNTK